ncbi:MAG: RsmB/NOP family class I SAM-dependent RNA methyltransferase [Ignavibacterium album]|jgi:16S rRNA (cytosine1407-C5)-methyltransferase|uniref:NOL1/NOP2/sun family putative RNA methylase n=1 Tax=Ignavibacterium album TaxID=591197 RepID=UPI0026EE4ECB|nr:RsmB/NOP family class I SAM-dependent RNA methyltransferase [Ignavibacterium album]MCX8104577.1 RsmB/NOP family class I SAM-dependent RNA methyltransferase [Ignavibacterium album]
MEKTSKAYEYFEKLYGKENAEAYQIYIEQTPKDYLRVNTSKISVDDLQLLLLEKYNIKTEQLQNFPKVLKVVSDEEGLIGKTVEQILGFYYIQGLSSMLPPIVLNPDEKDLVMDLCGAPGSKTTQMAEMMNNKGTLIVNEIDINRIKSLVFNLDRLNIINTGILNFKGEILSKVYNNYFDKILVDAPCSGLGIIQKKEEVSKWWSIEHAERLHDLQTKLLVAAIKMTKAGGEIVYSTCTLSVEENEIVIDTILKNYPVELVEVNLPVKIHKAFTKYDGKELNPQIEKAIRILPWEIDSDGFFLVKMKKISPTEPMEKMAIPKTDSKIVSPNDKEFQSYLIYLSDHFGIDKNIFDAYKFIFKGRDIYIINKDWYDDNLSIFNRIGTKFGSLDKKQRITLHSNGAQVIGNFASRFVYEITNIQDLELYLTGMKIKNVNVPTGQYIVKYNNVVLGTAVNNEEGFKSRFPRTKRTQKFEVM